VFASGEKENARFKQTIGIMTESAKEAIRKRLMILDPVNRPKAGKDEINHITTFNGIIYRALTEIVAVFYNEIKKYDLGRVIAGIDFMTIAKDTFCQAMFLGMIESPASASPSPATSVKQTTELLDSAKEAIRKRLLALDPVNQPKEGKDEIKHIATINGIIHRAVTEIVAVFFNEIKKYDLGRVIAAIDYMIIAKGTFCQAMFLGMIESPVSTSPPPAATTAGGNNPETTRPAGYRTV
jgi:hypothetical protein